MDTFSWVTLGIGLGSLGLVAARERHGSPAVDMQKRRADLSRFLDPKHNATPNERAMAERQLAKLPKATRSPAPTSTPPSRASTRSGVPPWQTDDRAMNSDIYRNDVSDLNFAKKAIYEHALESFKKGHVRLKVFLQGFDGAYPRGGFVAFTSALSRDLGYAGEVVEAWWMGGPLSGGRPHEAVIATFGTHERSGESAHQVVRIRGRDVAGRNLWVNSESFNSNPFNDPGFARALNAVIQAHGDSHG